MQQEQYFHTQGKKFHKQKQSIPRLPISSNESQKSINQIHRVNSFKSQIRLKNTKNQLGIKEIQSDELQDSDIQMIYFPQNLAKTQQFQSFNYLMETNERWKEQFQQLRSSHNSLIQMQLEFNDRQKNNLVSSMQKLNYQHFSTLLQKHWMNSNRGLNMPNIKIAKNSRENMDESRMEKPIYIRALGPEQINNQDQQIQQQQQQNQQLRTKRSQTQAKHKIIISPSIQDFQPLKIKLIISIASSDKYELQEDLSAKHILNRPSPRESGAIASLNNKIYLYGGIGLNLDKNLYETSLKDLVWKKVKLQTDVYQLSGQYGHTMINYKDNLLIFGGSKMHNYQLNIRQSMNDVILINPNDGKVKILDAHGRIPDRRRNHLSLILGKYLLIIGGIDQKGIYLDNIFQLNLDSGLWTQLECSNFFKNGIAFHNGFLVANQNVKFDGPQIKQEITSIKNIKIKRFTEEGIFIYGGQLGDLTINQSLILIKLGQEHLTSKQLFTKGQMPQPTYHQTVQYMEDKGLAIFIGGKNNITGVFSEISILDCETLIWCTVECYGYKCFHSTAMIDSKIIIFGGYDDTKYASTEIFIIETVSYLSEFNQQKIQDQQIARIKARQLDQQQNQTQKLNEKNMDQLINDKQYPQPLNIKQQDSIQKRSQIQELIQQLDIKKFTSSVVIEND